jgi:hypothetical protein
LLIYRILEPEFEELPLFCEKFGALELTTPREVEPQGEVRY